MLRDALGFHPESPRLDDDFRKRLGECIRVDVPAWTFLAIDYHLDWIQIAFLLDTNPDLKHGDPFLKPERGDINKDQEDIDLLIAFEGKEGSQAVTHLVLIEAKAYLPWSNEQLRSKARRLKEIFGADGGRHDAVKPHFVMMTERLSGKIDPCSWPDWMKICGDIPWLQYSLPSRTKVTRCTDSGTNCKNGTHLRLDLVP